MMLMKKWVMKMKIFKPLIALVKLLYKFIDKCIVVPISRLVYKINEFMKDNSGRFEKILNRPNILIYISLICAISIFVLVDSQVISLKETEAEVISGQKVNVLYNEEAYIVEGLPESVDITLIGSSSSIYLATQLGNHNVTLDLSDYSAGTYKVKLKYKNSVNSVDYKLDPSTVTVKISEKVSDNRSIDYSLMNENKLNEKLSISNVKLDTSEVVVKSSQEILNTVASVNAVIDASQITLSESGDFTLENVPLVAYDTNGNKIKNVEMVPAKVTATITIDSYNAIIPVKVVTSGKMESGKAIENLTSSITQVTVYGDKETVDALSSIEAPINVDNLSDGKTVSVTLKKPVGVRYMSESKTNVTVSVGTETQKQVDGVTVHFNGLASGYSVSAASSNDKTVNVILKGVESVLNQNADASSVYVYVDLSGYKTGTYTVPVYASIEDSRITVQPTKMEVSVKIVQSS